MFGCCMGASSGRLTSKNSFPDEVEGFNSDDIFPRRKGINSTKVFEIFNKDRTQFVGKIEDQNYSFDQTFSEFVPKLPDSDLNPLEGKHTPQLDACVLGSCWANLKPGEKKKAKCQDTTWMDEKEGKYIFGVLDGHGEFGRHVAVSSVILLSEVLHDCQSGLNRKGEPLPESKLRPSAGFFLKNESEYLRQCFKYIQEVMKISNDFSCEKSGTTATIATLSEEKLSLVWVGDSKAVLFVSTKEDFSEMKAFNVTSMHNLNTSEEKERIEQAGGIVGGAGNVFGRGKTGPMRVFNRNGNHEPGLNLSKSVGDEMAHDVGVNCEGDVFEIPLSTLTGPLGELKALIPDSFNHPDVDKGTPAYNEKYGVKKMKSKKRNTGMKTGSRLMRTLDRIRKTASLSRNKTKKKTKSSPVYQNTKDTSGLKKTFSEFSLKGEPLETQGTGFSSDLNLPASLGADDKSPIAHAILVVASDGLWNIFDKEDVAIFLSATLRTPDLGNLSRELCLQAQEKWKNYLSVSQTLVRIDDISAVSAVLF